MKSLAMEGDRKIDAFIKFGEIADTYGQQYSTWDLGRGYPAERIRLNLALELLKQIRPKRILDVGCGSGEPLLAFLKEGFDVHGFDYAAEMVAQARDNLRTLGYDPERITQNNMETMAGIPSERYDCIVALGSVYYARDFQLTMKNLVDLLPPGGHAVLSLRNDLFSLFSANRYTVEFFLKHLIPVQALSEEMRTKSVQYLESRFTEPEVARGFRTVDDQNIHSIYHNPLTVEEEVLRPVGLKLEGVYFYHFHALPPIFEHIAPIEFRLASLRGENPRDWRGLFQASAFVVRAMKVGQ